MEFPTYNFEKMGETDIREEIVAPLLRHLGYRAGTPNNVIREQHLTYPKLALGRKKVTDPYLRGKADYICEASNLVKWVIEAKAPGETLNEEIEEQAWSYANHPEIRAIYFVITNGRHFKIYQTNRGAEAAAIFECRYEEMNVKLATIENLLSPPAIIRDHPAPLIDIGIPLGPGLRSIVRITSGHIRYTKLSSPVPPLQEMVMAVTKGSVERMENGKLEAHLWSLVPFQSLQALNEKLGLDHMQLISDSHVISTDPAKPTVFESERKATLPQGTKALDLMTWKEISLPININSIVRTRASGYLAGTTFIGSFHASMRFLEQGINFTLDGEYQLQLA